MPFSLTQGQRTSQAPFCLKIGGEGAAKDQLSVPSVTIKGLPDAKKAHSV